MSQPAKIRGIAILMRHGETAWNREGRVMGRNPVEIDEVGRRQVESAAALATLLKPTLIVTSPLVRARQSADIIASGLGVRIVEEPLLEEVRYGRWEGMTYHQLITDEHFEAYRKAPVDVAPPGGETVREVQKRGVDAVKKALAENNGGRVLFVSHGDIIRSVLCHFMGLDLKYFHRIRVDNATFFGMEVVDDFAEVKFLNLIADPTRVFLPPFKR